MRRVLACDGSNPQRLSDFNADGDVETNLLNSDSVIARVALTCHGA